MDEAEHSRAPSLNLTAVSRKSAAAPKPLNKIVHLITQKMKSQAAASLKLKPHSIEEQKRAGVGESMKQSQSQSIFLTRPSYAAVPTREVAVKNHSEIVQPRGTKATGTGTHNRLAGSAGSQQKIVMKNILQAKPLSNDHIASLASVGRIQPTTISNPSRGSALKRAGSQGLTE